MKEVNIDNKKIWGYIAKFIEIAEALKDALKNQDEQKTKKNEELRLDCIKNLEQQDPSPTSIYAEWLKSLRPQPEPEWSEKDDYHYNKLEMFLEVKEHETSSSQYQREVHETLEWLKSLKSQKQWKPSEEQINTLEYYMHTLVCNEYKEILFGLYTDLKKLRGE